MDDTQHSVFGMDHESLYRPEPSLRAQGKGGKGGNGDEKMSDRRSQHGDSRGDDISTITPAEGKRQMTKWTDEEKRICIEAMGQLGKNWAEIANYMGHTKRPEQIKNFYQNYKKRYGLDEKLPGGPQSSRRGRGEGAAAREAREERERAALAASAAAIAAADKAEKAAVEKEKEKASPAPPPPTMSNLSVAVEKERAKINVEREEKEKSVNEKASNSSSADKMTTSAIEKAVAAALAASSSREAMSNDITGKFSLSDKAPPSIKPPPPPPPESRLPDNTQDLTAVAAAVLAQLAGGAKAQQQQQNSSLRHYGGASTGDHLDFLTSSQAAVAAALTNAAKNPLYSATTSASSGYSRFPGVPYGAYPTGPPQGHPYYGLSSGGSGGLPHALLRGYAPPSSAQRPGANGGTQLSDIYRAAYEAHPATHPASLLSAEALGYAGLSQRKGRHDRVVVVVVVLGGGVGVVVIVLWGGVKELTRVSECVVMVLIMSLPAPMGVYGLYPAGKNSMVLQSGGTLDS